MRRNERGQALMISVVAVSLVLLALLTALAFAQFSGRSTSRQLISQGQALNAAQAGLIEGLSWFRRQTTQPVTSFAPVRDTSKTPPIDDTELSSTGLVRTYKISDSGNLWGRYQLQATSVSGTNTVDITAQRGKKGTGIVWQLESEGAVWVRNDASKAYDAKPNIVLARRKLRTEIQRLGMNRPADAAVCVARGGRVQLDTTDVVVSGKPKTGMVYTEATGTPGGSSGLAVVSGSPQTALLKAAPDPFSIPYIFGVNKQELRTMADMEVTKVADLPTTLPEFKLIILNGPGTTFSFDSTRPLSGSGILVVFGNLEIKANSSSTFNGLIYVEGSYTQAQPSSVYGQVIVKNPDTAGSFKMSGASENAEIRYDQGVLDYTARRLGLYNISRSPYIPCPTGQTCD